MCPGCVPKTTREIAVGGWTDAAATQARDASAGSQCPEHAERAALRLGERVLACVLPRVRVERSGLAARSPPVLAAVEIGQCRVQQLLSSSTWHKPGSIIAERRLPPSTRSCSIVRPSVRARRRSRSRWTTGAVSQAAEETSASRRQAVVSLFSVDALWSSSSAVVSGDTLETTAFTR